MSAKAEDLGALEAEAREAIAAAPTPQALTEARARFLGRKGSVSKLLREIGGLDPAQRSRVGQAVNTAKERIEQARGRQLDPQGGHAGGKDRQQ